MKNMMKMVVLFNILILLLTGCDYERRPSARIQDTTVAVITNVTRGSWYVKRHYYVSKVEVYNEKYDIYATFSSESAGMFHQPKYWNSKEGDLIPVVITIDYFTDTNEIYNITMREKH